MPKFIQKAANFLGNLPVVGDVLNSIAINKYANAIPNRPRPLSMAANYTTWRGLTDRCYSGRHLPPDPNYNKNLPALDKVVDLFRQTSDRRANDTSLLFPFFAQWFTDSFLRTQWKPAAEQDFAHTESNHEIDLCQIYGINEDRTATLRSFNGGKLKSQFIKDEEYPVPLFQEINGELKVKPEFEGLYTKANFERVFSQASDAHKRNCFAVGLEHGNSTMGNTLMNVLFLREHNRIAGLLQTKYPSWDDERIFQTARNINIVLLLNIVISDYIVHIAPIDFPLRAIPGKAEKEHWYRNNWIAVEFALLYRWHSFIPASVKFDGQEKSSAALRHANGWIQEIGIDNVCRQASSQKAGYLTLGNTPEFLLDVEKLSLNMGRVCQLQSYNQYCGYYGLPKKSSFNSLTSDKNLAKKLEELYKTVDNVEWLVGLFAESYDKESMMGELMITMVANDAFTQALTNPLLSSNVFNTNTFSELGMEIIQNTFSLADIIVRNTHIKNKKEVGFKVGKSNAHNVAPSPHSIQEAAEA
jgi:prostaglandin-endoperoxide synthase 2